MTINKKETTGTVQLNPSYESNVAPETTAHYCYCPKTFVATNVVQVAADEEVPEMSTRWKPPQCEDGVQAYFNGIGWVRCVALDHITPELIRDVQLDIAERELRETLRTIKDGAVAAETETYLQQYVDAQDYIATGTASTFLRVLSEARGKPLDDLARTIVRKADAYHTATAGALAKYQNAVDEIAGSKPALTQEMLMERRLQR